MKKLAIIYILLCSSTFSCYAQEMWGMVNSNFSGNIGVDINPATLVGMPMTSEFHIISGDLFIYNNYIYLPSGIFALGNLVTGDLGKDVLQDRYIDDPLKKGYMNASFKGPSFLWSRETWGLSIHTALRNHLSVENYPYHIAKFNWEGIDYEPQHNIWYNGKDFKSTGISYGELGVSLGGALLKTENELLSVGFSVKKLFGFNSVYARIDNVDYIIPVKQLLIVDNINMEYGHAMADYETNATRNPFKIRGGGWSGNIGMSYQNGRNDRAYAKTSRKYEPMKKYNFRLGFSIMDVGSINWKNDARRFLFEDASTIWPGIDTVKFDDITYFDSIVSVQFTGDAERSLVADQYRTFLPSAVSAQVDVALSAKIYVNVSGIKGFRLNDPGVRRPDQVSITARYETRYLEISLPYSWYEFEHHRIGLAVRWGPFWLGSDRIGAFTGIDDTDGIDIYFGLKWAFYNGNRGGKNKNCFAF